MIDIIFWILIGICCFYLGRNFYVGFLFSAAGIIKNKVEKDLSRVYGKLQNKPMFVPIRFRNYYLFVFNPFWWRLVDVFADEDWRQLFKDIMKDPVAAAFKFMKN